MPEKTKCPISRKQFQEHAKGLDVVIGGQTFRVPTKEFSTGSLGWYLNGKTNLEIDGKDVTIQIGLNLTIVGSKDLPKEPGSSDAPTS